MDEQLTLAAKSLARWCYARGLDERLLGCGEQLRRLAVDQALGRPAPAHLEQALWQQTATLLRQRRDWDRDHQVTPPAPAACLPCAVAADQCPTHDDRRCRACGGQLHRIVVDEGFDTHPCCDRPGTNGSLAFLEHTAQRWEPHCSPSRRDRTRPVETDPPRVIAPTPGTHLGDQGGLAQPVPAHGMHGSSHE